MGVALTLLVDGHLVVGVCGRSMDYAEQTAASLGRAMESAAIEPDVVEPVTRSLVELEERAHERERNCVKPSSDTELIRRSMTSRRLTSQTSITHSQSERPWTSVR